MPFGMWITPKRFPRGINLELSIDELQFFIFYLHDIVFQNSREQAKHAYHVLKFHIIAGVILKLKNRTLLFNTINYKLHQDGVSIEGFNPKTQAPNGLHKTLIVRRNAYFLRIICTRVAPLLKTQPQKNKPLTMALLCKETWAALNELKNALKSSVYYHFRILTYT